MEQTTDCVKAGCFKLVRRVGAGCFGTVFSANSIKTNEEVAMKLEEEDCKHGQLQYEATLMKKFKGESKKQRELLCNQVYSWISTVHLVRTRVEVQLSGHDHDGAQYLAAVRILLIQL
jgi:hypothetical protein